MNIVYIVKNSPENNSEELRYSLRSLENIPHDKVILVGEKPDWARNVTHVAVAQSDTKHVNWARNMATAALSDQVSDEFLMMNDDFFIMKAVQKMPALHFGYMRDVIACYEARYPEGSDYIARMKLLYELLVAKDSHEPISYELHTPMVLSKKNVRSMYEKSNGPLYQFRTYYGNMFNVGGTAVADVKIFKDPIHNDSLFNENPLRYLQHMTFLSTTGGSFKAGVAGDYVRNSFTKKSKYEA